MAVFPGNPLMCTGIVFWVFFIFQTYMVPSHVVSGEANTKSDIVISGC